MGINEQNINQRQITMKNINIENKYNKDYLEKGGAKLYSD